MSDHNWTPDQVDAMTLLDVADLDRREARYPPLRVLMAAWMGVKTTGRAPDAEMGNPEDLLGMIARGEMRKMG